MNGQFLDWLVDLFVRGGVLMYPIAFSSLVALGIFIERMWVLQRSRVVPSNLVHHVGRLLEAGKFNEAEALVESSDSSIAAILRAGFAHRGRRREVIKETFEEAGRQEVAALERYVGALGTVANVTPLLGLLGTVAGMIQAFQQVVLEVADSSAVDPGHLATGIWAALITTAAGLTVAIPAHLAHKYLQARIDSFALEMEEVALGVVDLLEDPDDRPAPVERQGHEPGTGEGGRARAEGVG